MTRRRGLVGLIGIVGLALTGLVVVITMVVAGGTRSDLPTSEDYVAIGEVAVSTTTGPTARPGASTGSFGSRCGRNEAGHRNRDNLITEPGRPGGAHHLHEYVGNLSTDAFSTDASLASADSTCTNGDLSTYYWPVLRPGRPGHAGHGSEGGSAGEVLPAVSVEVVFSGNPTSKVVAMPRFLRMIAGDPRAATSDEPVALARWGCTGHPDRQTALYPRCEPGQRVVRTFEFPGCWDGRRTDSPDHRSHVAHQGVDGSCPHDTFPIPRLRVRVTYAVPAGEDYTVDTLPDQQGSPLTDHADFVNVMPEPLMARAVHCINGGRDC